MNSYYVSVDENSPNPRDYCGFRLFWSRWIYSSYSKSFNGFWFAWARDPFTYKGDRNWASIVEGFSTATNGDCCEFKKESLMHLGCYFSQDQSVTKDNIDEVGDKVRDETRKRLVEFIDEYARNPRE